MRDAAVPRNSSVQSGHASDSKSSSRSPVTMMRHRSNEGSIALRNRNAVAPPPNMLRDWMPSRTRLIRGVRSETSNSRFCSNGTFISFSLYPLKSRKAWLALPLSVHPNDLKRRDKAVIDRPTCLCLSLESPTQTSRRLAPLQLKENACFASGIAARAATEAKISKLSPNVVRLKTRSVPTDVFRHANPTTAMAATPIAIDIV